MSNATQNNRMTLLPVNESFIEKSIISQLPQHHDGQHLSHLQSQIGRLREELQFYKKQATKPKTEPFSFRDIEKGGSTQQTNEIDSLRQENQQQKQIIKKISQQLRSKKKSLSGGDLTAECQRLQYINQKLQSENAKISAQNDQLKRQLQEARKPIKGEGQSKISLQLQQLRRKNLQHQLKIEEMTEATLQYVRQIDSLNQQIEKLRRQNVIDRGPRKSNETLRAFGNAQNSRYSVINMQNSRAFSELDLLDTERLNLKISQKNKEYEQLYLKYQSLENQFHAVQQINNDLERQRKFLAERLSDIEIHTQGDEIVGELENKLVLMSTELMRLGNLSRTKTQQNKELNMRIKQLILKRQNLQKDIIQRDKLIINYKQEIRLIEIRNNERSVMQSRVEKDSQIREKTAKLTKQIQRLTILVKQKSQALKNSDIKNAILEQKNVRLEKENEELEKENKELASTRDRNKSIHTKLLNLQAEVNYFKQANSGLKDQMKRYESRFYQNRSDIQKLTREKQETRQNNLDLQDKVRNTQEELRRLQVQIDDKSMQLREVNHKSEEKVMLKTNEIKKLEEKVIILQKQVQRSIKNKSQSSKYEQLVRQIHRLEEIQLSLKLQINTYQQKIALVAQQNERLTERVDEIQKDRGTSERYKFQSEQKERKIKDLQKQLDTSSNRQKRYKEQNESLREKIRENIVQERQGEIWQFKNRQLRDEIDGLKTQLGVRDEQIRNINERYRKQSNQKYALLLRNQELNSKLTYGKTQNVGSDYTKDHHESENKRLNAEIRLKNEKFHKLQLQHNEVIQNYSTLSGEIERLNIVLQQRVRQVMNYKKQVDFLQHKVRTCEESLRQRTVNQIGSQKSIMETESKTKIEFCQGKIRNVESELELMKQRYQNLKRDYSLQESKLNQALNERFLIEQKSNELEFQLSEKSSNFRHVQQSFKLTILQVKKSNERLQSSLKQIQNHYIGKLQAKEREYEYLNNEKKVLQNEIHELQRKYSSIQSHYGTQIKQKNQFISNLHSNHSQTIEEIAEIKRIKSEYEVKITLLSQEIQRLTQYKNRQHIEIEQLKDELRNNQNKFSVSLQQTSKNSQTIDILSTEIERLNTVLVQNVQKIKDYTKKSNRLEIHNSQLLKDLELQTKKLNQRERLANEERQTFTDRIEKLQELNKELKYQLQEKSKDAEKFLDKMQSLQRRSQEEKNQQMKSVAEQMRLIREGNQKLQNKLGVITRQYEQLVTQLQYYKRPKSGQSDEKMRIIGNYQATIKHMKEENSSLNAQKSRLQAQYERVAKLSHEVQERGKISEQKSRVLEQKCRRLDERCRVLEQRTRNSDQVLKMGSTEKKQVEQKLLQALDEVSRLQAIIKSKQAELQKIQNTLTHLKSQNHQNIDYNGENIKDKKGIFVIKQVSQFDQRSRSASGNGLQPPVRHPVNPQAGDLQHRYELLESINKKLSAQCQCLRKKSVEYEFKMSKLKEQFDLINRLIHEYRDQNEKLKQNNKTLTTQLQQRGNSLISAHSQFSSPQHSSIRSNSYLEANYRSNLSPTHFPQKSNEVMLRQKQESVTAKAKLIEEIDRLNKINNSLQNQIHDLRLNSTDAISLRKRYEQNLALMVILFTEVESLRMRIRETEKNQMLSPRKG